MAIKSFQVTIDLGHLSSRETTRYLVGWNKIFRCCVDFDSVTSAQEQRFVAAASSKHAIDLGVASEVFARLHVSAVMAQTDAEQIHGVCVCAVNVMPQRSVSAALNPIMQSAATLFGANHWK